MQAITNNKNYYTHIDGLRALAVISVFLCHLDFTVFSGGFVGVDVFFVISGFLISNIIIQQINSPSGFSFLTFYERRIKRIFPALFFTLWVAFIASVLLLNAAAFKVFGKSLMFATLSASNIFFKNQSGYFDIFSQSSPLLHTWSLSVEEQFYIFFPIILLLGQKIKGTVILIALILITSFSLNIYYQDTNLIDLYYLVQYRTFEFCIGALLVFLIKYEIKTSYFLKEFLCLLGTLFIVSTTLIFNSNTLFPSYNALIPCIGAALVIYAGTAKYMGYIYRCFPARQIGLISYSLYLIHWPLIIFFKTYHQDIGLDFAISFNEKILIISLALICAYFMYYFIEQPFRNIKNISSSRWPQLKPIAQGLCLVCFIAFLGHFIHHSQGWTWRIRSADELAKIKDISEYHTQYWGGAGFKGGMIHKGKTEKAKIVVLGDSHAGMLDEGMVYKIAIPEQITVFTASGGGAGKYLSSLLLPGITRLDKSQQAFDESAKSAYKEALNNLDASGVLILSSSWYAQLPLAATLRDHHSLNIDTTVMSSYDDYKPVFNAIDKLKKHLGKRKLIIIGDVPGSQYHPVNCFGQLKWLKQSSCPLTDIESLNTGAFNVNKILALYASLNDNVYFLNPYEIFCKKGHCMSVDSDGHPYYSDGGHLSKIGSKFLISHWKTKIMDILNSSS